VAPLLVGGAASVTGVRLVVEAVGDSGRARSDDWSAMVAAIVFTLAHVGAMLLGYRWVALRCLRIVRSHQPGTVLALCMVGDGFYGAARSLGGGIGWMTRRRPTTYGVVAVDGVSVTVWFGSRVRPLAVVPAASVESVSAGRSPAGPVRMVPSLLLSVRTRETDSTVLPFVVVRWSGLIPRALRPVALDELVDQVRLRLAAGRAEALPPAG
jgi:hypothetical protein